MAPTIEPSAVITAALRLVRQRGQDAMMNLCTDTEDDFSSDLEAALAGIAMDSQARQTANNAFNGAWSQNAATKELGEVVIGGGYHAAVYAATRYKMGYPRPVVLERSNPSRVGGSFAVTERPSFWLNSRNRPGGPGIAGDSRTSLNYIPGGIIQPASIGMGEFQSNADMAFCIRATLAQYATVAPYTDVTGVTVDFNSGTGVGLRILDPLGERSITAKRVIDARGLGNPFPVDGGRVLSFPELMQRMEQPFPLRGLRRVAVIGGGDSGKCAVESFLGLAPEPMLSPASVGHVERVDWYGPNIPDRCKEWVQVENARGEQVRGRYRSIGHYLRRDAYGVRRLNVYQESVVPSPFPDGVLIRDRVYDLVVSCVGNAGFSPLPGVEDLFRTTVLNGAGEAIARTLGSFVFQVGPVAYLPFTATEQTNGVADFQQNRVSMFRTGKMTAALAVKLPPV